MKIITIALFLIVSAYTFLSCSDGNPIEHTNDFPNGISGETSFMYEFLGKAPIHTQSSMLTGYQNKLYRFGSEWPVQTLDLDTKEWSQIPLPDSSYWGWDGLAVTVGSIIYIASVSSESNSYDIVRLNPETSTFTHTDIILPETFQYPAYCVNNDKIVFFSMKTDSVYEYNTSKNELIKIADNPFYVSSYDNPFYVSSYDNMSLSSGRGGNYLYVFGGLNNLPNNLFYRLDLINYNWEKLEMPKDLRTKYLFGSTFGEQFVLFSDSSHTYEFSFSDEKWYQSIEELPIYPLTLQGTPEFWTEWSFYSDGESLFATEIFNDKVWKISK